MERDRGTKREARKTVSIVLQTWRVLPWFRTFFRLICIGVFSYGSDGGGVAFIEDGF